MNYKEAKSLYKEWYANGKAIHKDPVFPYNDYYKDEEFIRKIVYIKDIRVIDVDDELVAKYKKILKNHSMDNPWLKFGRSTSVGITPPFDGLLEAVDGNHRIAAMKKMKKKKIEVIMPASHYKLYMESK